MAAAPVTTLSVTLVGGFTLTAGDDVVDLPVLCQRVVALLALGGRTSRSRVAGTIWPQASEDRASASLRTVIWRVNRVADGLVRSHGPVLDLGPFVDVDVDVRRLTRAGLTVPWDGSATDRGALDPDPGDAGLLPAWDDAWLLADRERLRQLRLHVLEAQAGRLSADGRYGLALETALTALRADPLRESAHRTVIGIHLAEGNVAALDEMRGPFRPTLWEEPPARSTQDIKQVWFPATTATSAGDTATPGSARARWPGWSTRPRPPSACRSTHPPAPRSPSTP